MGANPKIQWVHKESPQPKLTRLLYGILIDKLQTSSYSLLSITLEYLISVGVRLLIFMIFSTQYALIPYHTFINFMINFQPIRLFHTVCFPFTYFLLFFPSKCSYYTREVSL